ncbi:MAG: sulfotransferase [Leptolyngbya sp. SIO4C1]|nr:sulfotransferase [Leptolyngbya sp. SIO4C1]
MSISEQGENLIFLISQPRSGSTLLQRILGGHPSIFTTAEPWLMLHPLYALKYSGYETDYRADLARDALDELFAVMPDQEDTYFKGLRKMYSFIYSSIADSSEKKIFLDKTPRYYYVVPELYRVFPKAKFIILARNPLAVLCSIYRTWIQPDWNRLYRFRDDLILAPELIRLAVQTLGDSCLLVNYEDILDKPAIEVEKICKWLKIEFDAEILNYRSSFDIQWKLGDQSKINTYNTPRICNRDAWVNDLKQPQIWRCVHDYIETLDEELLKDLRYSRKDLSVIVNSNQPNPISRFLTFPLSLILTPPNQRKDFDISLWCLMLVSSFKKRGFLKSIQYIPKKFFKKSGSSSKV